ncbi:DSD1 family PLP-dependent enzyme [Polymorphobacter sp. PAMC 29334]|uniref:DSD1 family PLP-dependent enzyme n=1 Tax=Polymorphobacter sp. PAMC 29334 TaxID=2862331 RepID=UPI001C6845AE|nr:DSD1 family PLP-dependent enzyme [Polymorphobacter sp. PAMC 29334]QYE34206.1 DSD1 family PLP-dependent enzyme [Polymorphobacter sp. PAMC 29334]
MTDEELHGHLIDRQGSRRDFNTPVLVVDLDALDRNIARMAEFAAANGLQLRPHAKTHKSPEIARRQVAAGAIGACCAKLGEAEVLADGGIHGLHITSPVVSPPAIARLVALNARVDGLMCVVDNVDNVHALGRAATGGKPLSVIIDIDPGIRRTGVGSPAAAVELLEAIRDEPGLSYAGVQCYCGMQQHIEGYADRATSMTDRANFVREVIAALTGAGGSPNIVTGGGTGTHRIDATLDLFTELQVGSYVFMDSQYLACDLTGDEGGSPFETALMIDTRVVSNNATGMATVDGGFKAFSTDADPPLVIAGAPDGSKYFFMGDEHGALIVPEGKVPGLAEIVTFAAPHCDPTVNLYDTYHVVQGDTLRALWPVAARGRSR